MAFGSQTGMRHNFRAVKKVNNLIASVMQLKLGRSSPALPLLNYYYVHRAFLSARAEVAWLRADQINAVQRRSLLRKNHRIMRLLLQVSLFLFDKVDKNV